MQYNQRQGHGDLISTATDGDESLSLQSSFQSKNNRSKASLIQDDREKADENKGKRGLTTESPTKSVGESLMESLHNKTPDSLPKDDSELLSITEGAEEDDSVSSTGDKSKGTDDEERSVEGEEDEVGSDVSNQSSSSQKTKAGDEEVPVTETAEGEDGAVAMAMASKVMNVPKEGLSLQGVENQESDDSDVDTKDPNDTPLDFE
jgi:hypothetical protein